MLKAFFTLLITAAGSFTFAQDKEIIKENWVEKPVLHTIDPKHANEGAVIILDRRRIQLVDEANGELVAYQTLHKIIRVNDDRGIESFNKFYLGIADNSDIVDIRARTILPDKRVVEIDRNNVKDMKEEDGSMYKIFAMEGITKDSEIEYIFTHRRSATYFGREIIQGAFPVLKAEVEVITPERLVYETRSYNAKIEPTESVANGRRMVRMEQSSIPGVEEEKYSFYRANLQRIEYKLSYNLSRNKERVFTWNELAKRIYDIYNTFSEKEMKRVGEWVKKNNWHKLPDELSKICAVEAHVKVSFTNRDDISSDQAVNLEQVLKNKIASDVGIVRLYAAAFKELGISTQLVLSGDRQSFAVDKSFENWNNTDNVLILFNSTNRLMAPTRIDLRYPWIDPHWAGTEALFCKITTVGNFTTAMAEVKPIQLEGYKASENNIEANVSFTDKADSLVIDTRQSYSGYSASVYRSSFNFANQDQKKEFLKQLVKFNTNSEHILSSKIENQDFESYNTNKPFSIQAVVKSKELLERAGNKLLLKVGMLIGSQVEMYQDKPRMLPMEMGYPHVLARKISIIVPKGYEIKNLDDLKIEKVVKENEQPTMQFVSNYVVKDNIITINIVEEYRQAMYPREQYQQFRDIINAAADFNKIVLVLEKNKTMP